MEKTILSGLSLAAKLYIALQQVRGGPISWDEYGTKVIINSRVYGGKNNCARYQGLLPTKVNSLLGQLKEEGFSCQQIISGISGKATAMYECSHPNFSKDNPYEIFLGSPPKVDLPARGHPQPTATYDEVSSLDVVDLGAPLTDETSQSVQVFGSWADFLMSSNGDIGKRETDWQSVDSSIKGDTDQEGDSVYDGDCESETEVHLSQYISDVKPAQLSDRRNATKIDSVMQTKIAESHMEYSNNPIPNSNQFSDDRVAELDLNSPAISTEDNLLPWTLENGLLCETKYNESQSRSSVPCTTSSGDPEPGIPYQSVPPGQAVAVSLGPPPDTQSSEPNPPGQIIPVPEDPGVFPSTCEVLSLSPPTKKQRTLTIDSEQEKSFDVNNVKGGTTCTNIIPGHDNVADQAASDINPSCPNEQFGDANTFVLKSFPCAQHRGSPHCDQPLNTLHSPVPQIKSNNKSLNQNCRSSEHNPKSPSTNSAWSGARGSGACKQCCRPPMIWVPYALTPLGRYSRSLPGLPPPVPTGICGPCHPPPCCSMHSKYQHNICQSSAKESATSQEKFLWRKWQRSLHQVEARNRNYNSAKRSQILHQKSKGQNKTENLQTYLAVKKPDAATSLSDNF